MSRRVAWLGAVLALPLVGCWGQDGSDDPTSEPSSAESDSEQESDPEWTDPCEGNQDTAGCFSEWIRRRENASDTGYRTLASFSRITAVCRQKNNYDTATPFLPYIGRYGCNDHWCPSVGGRYLKDDDCFPTDHFMVSIEASGPMTCATGDIKSAWDTYGVVAEGASLRAVHGNYDAGVYLAVGDGGRVVQSGDLGLTWNEVSSGLSADLRGVAVADDAVRAVAVGSEGTVALSSDAGLTWSALESSTGNTLLGVYVLSSTWLIVGEGPTLLRIDETDAVTVLEPPGTETLFDVAHDGKAWLVASGDGNIYRSEDAGESWRVDLENPGDGAIIRLAAHPDNFAVAATTETSTLWLRWQEWEPPVE